jgi:hypothetical protein
LCHVCLKMAMWFCKRNKKCGKVTVTKYMKLMSQLTLPNILDVNARSNNFPETWELNKILWCCGPIIQVLKCNSREMDMHFTCISFYNFFTSMESTTESRTVGDFLSKISILMNWNFCFLLMIEV